MEQSTLFCIESRVENNRSFYGRFHLGPFDLGQGLTIANAFRRTLLSELPGVAITRVEIEGATHEYSTIKGVKESVLDILLNLKKIVLTTDFQIQQPLVGYLQVQGPSRITAKDMRLPLSIKSVDPDQYIATLSGDGFLNLKFVISQGKGYHDLLVYNNKRSIFLPSSTTLPIDATFMPISKVNFLVDTYTSIRSIKPKERIILEIWTDGSIHPRKAIYDAAKVLIQLFSFFQPYTQKENERFITHLDIGNFDFSLRPYTCLKRANINTIGELLQYSSEDLLLLKNFGKRSLKEVENNLKRMGLQLRNSHEIKETNSTKP